MRGQDCTTPQGRDEQPGPVAGDLIIEAYKRDIDRSLLQENLTLTIEQRFEKLAQLQRFAAELRRARHRASP